MSNDEKKIQPIFQILHIKSAWFLLELAMALVTTIGMRFLQVCVSKAYFCLEAATFSDLARLVCHSSGRKTKKVRNA